MAFTDEKLDLIYHKTTGYCHICHRKLARRNYGLLGERGAWEVEHANPRSKGGTDHLNNLYPACIICNRDKSNRTTKTARSWHDKKRAPLSPAKRKAAKSHNAVLGAAGGAVLGSMFGPAGAAFGAMIGGIWGHEENPDQ
jgi:hypothetical protein